MDKVSLKFSSKKMHSLPYTGIACSKSKKIAQVIINKLCAICSIGRGLMIKKEGDVLAITEGRMLLMLPSNLFPNQKIFGEHFEKGYVLKNGIASEFVMPNYKALMPKKSVQFYKIEPKEKYGGKLLCKRQDIIYEIWTNGECDIPISKIYLDIFRKITITLPDMFQEDKNKSIVMADPDKNIVGMVMPARGNE